MTYKAPLSSDYQLCCIDNSVCRKKKKEKLLSLLYVLGATGSK